MLVWRIDYADKSTVSLGDFPNNEKGISRVMVVPADGLVINQANCGDGMKYTWDEYDQTPKTTRSQPITQAKTARTSTVLPK